MSEVSKTILTKKPHKGYNGWRINGDDKCDGEENTTKRCCLER